MVLLCYIVCAFFSSQSPCCDQVIDGSFRQKGKAKNMPDRQQLQAVTSEDGSICCPLCKDEGKSGLLARSDDNGIRLYCPKHNADVHLPLKLRKVEAVHKALDILAAL